MARRFKFLLGLTVALILMAGAGTAAAQIALRFSPADSNVEPGSVMRISVMLDDAVDFRTIDLTVTYDSTLIRTISGGQGALFADSGFFTWEGFEESVPGLWHGFAIVMGAEDSLSGPGELFTWEVEGLVQGITTITAIETHLRRPDSGDIPDVTLDPTTVTVVWAPTPVENVPAFQPGLKIFPNPFNPGTRIGFDLPMDSHVMLSVFDARGRRVVTLHEGDEASGPLHFDWDGRDAHGAVQPGGVYLFRLDSQQDGATYSATTKGILLK